MRALNKSWIASGMGNLFTKVLDPETKEWVLPCHTAAALRKRKATRENYTVEQQAPRRRPNHPRAPNSSSHVLRVPSQEEIGKKKSKTVKDMNAALAPGMAASMEQWSSKEQRKLLDAYDVYGDKWKDVAAAVGSRTWRQCMTQYKKLKKANRLDPISEGTLLRPLIFGGFTNKAFDRCVAEIDGKRITTVGQLAALDLDISKEENKIYLRKLTKCRDFAAAVKMAAKWKAKAIEALAFWQ